MFINISKLQLMDSEFLNDLVACTNQFNLREGEFVLEITESAIVGDLDNVVPILNELRTMGFHVAIDDFGTGVSSFSTLHKLPVNILKIDQSFVRTLDEDESILEIVSSVTKLAKQMGIQTVGQGIETSSSVEAMQSTECTFGQGYFYSRPLSVADAETYLIENRNRFLNNRAA